MTPGPHHRLHLRGSLAGLDLDLHLHLAAPWTVLFGPSGCGKSTTLRAIAGLAPPHLHILLERDESEWKERERHKADRLEPTGRWTALDSPRKQVPPHLRRIAFAPQEPSLLPHRSVRENLLFPAQLAGQRHPPPDFLRIADLLELTPLLHRRPHQLSGGERQRVNLARALLVPAPRLLLLDEPLAAVGRDLRTRLLPALHSLAAERHLPVLSVTHEFDEPLLLAAEVVRLDHGRILAQGPAATVLAPERQAMLHLLHR